MKRKCRILWVDDDFAKSSANCGAMEANANHVKGEFEKSEIEAEIQTCVYVDDFLALANEKPWDVFIIDINGYENSIAKEKMEPDDLMYTICEGTKKCNVIRYCLTGQPTLDPQKEGRHRSLDDLLKNNQFVPDEKAQKPANYWWKNGRVMPMAESLIARFSDEFGPYNELRELCQFVNGSDKEYIRQLAKWKTSEEECEFPDYGKLRTALKDGVLLNALPLKFFCGVDVNFNFFRDDKYLRDNAIEAWQRYPITFLSILNTGAHSNDELSDNLVDEMVFNAVLVFANWLLNFLKNADFNNLDLYVKLPVSSNTVSQAVQKPSSIQGTLKVEKHYIMHVDDCLVPPDVLACYFNEKKAAIEITKCTSNPFDKTKECYPRMAKEIKIKY